MTQYDNTRNTTTPTINPASAVADVHAMDSEVSAAMDASPALTAFVVAMQAALDRDPAIIEVIRDFRISSMDDIDRLFGFFLKTIDPAQCPQLGA